MQGQRLCHAGLSAERKRVLYRRNRVGQVKRLRALFFQDRAMRLATARKSSSVGDEQSGKMEGISSSSPSLKLPSRTLVHDILPLPRHAARHVFGGNLF